MTGTSARNGDNEELILCFLPKGIGDDRNDYDFHHVVKSGVAFFLPKGTGDDRNWSGCAWIAYWIYEVILAERHWRWQERSQSVGQVIIAVLLGLLAERHWR